MQEIEEVLKAEKQAEMLISKAEEDRDKFIITSKQKALEGVAKEKEKIDTHFSALIKKKAQELGTERKKILAQAEKEISKIKEVAIENSKQAGKIILDAVLQQEG